MQQVCNFYLFWMHLISALLFAAIVPGGPCILGMTVCGGGSMCVNNICSCPMGQLVLNGMCSPSWSSTAGNGPATSQIMRYCNLTFQHHPVAGAMIPSAVLVAQYAQTTSAPALLVRLCKTRFALHLAALKQVCPPFRYAPQLRP